MKKYNPSAYDTQKKHMKWKKVPCAKCNGTGKRGDKTCRNCMGKGTSREVNVISTSFRASKSPLYGSRFYQQVDTIVDEKGYKFL